jgi:hypothetical protein
MFDKLKQHLNGMVSFFLFILPLFLSLRGWQIYRTEKLDDMAVAILKTAIRQTSYNQLLVAPNTL